MRAVFKTGGPYSFFKNGRCEELEEVDQADCGNFIRDYGRCGVYEFGE
jgi:hypothetical protein